MTMGSRKLTDERIEVEFRGEAFEVSLSAYRSARVQKGLALAGDPERQAEAYAAIDALCCGRSDEYMGRIPPESGEVGPYGCSNEDLGAFLAEAVQAAAKN